LNTDLRSHFVSSKGAISIQLFRVLEPLVSRSMGRISANARRAQLNGAAHASSSGHADTVSERRAQYVDDARANTLARNEIVDMLDAQPWKILRTLMYVKGLKENTGNGPSTVADEVDDQSIPWPSTYATHRKIPKYWIMRWLASVSARWSTHVLEEVDKADTKNIRKLLEIGTGISEGRSLNPALRSKVLLARFYTKLEKELGGRLSNFPVDIAISDGVIDWSKVSVYTAEFVQDDRGIRAELAHRYRGWKATVRLPPDMQSFKIIDEHSDESAKVDDDTLKFSMKTRFTAPDCKEFFAFLQMSNLHKIAEGLDSVMAEQQICIGQGALTNGEDAMELKQALKKRKVAPPAGKCAEQLVCRPPIRNPEDAGME
jgi:hypothetical protein